MQRQNKKVDAGIELFGASLGASCSAKYDLDSIFPPKGGVVPLTPNRKVDTCYNTYAGVMGLVSRTRCGGQPSREKISVD